MRIPRTTRSLPRTLVVAATALALSGTAACDGSGGRGESAPTSSGSSGGSGSTAMPTTGVDVPSGVDLTAPGTSLELGGKAAVVSEPDQNHGSVLQLRVTAIKRASIRDFSSFVLDKRTRASRPYYVDVTIKNLGPDDLGGARVPLFGVDQTDTLIQSSVFSTPFPTCSSTSLPDTFSAGDRATRCLVFLAPDHGKIDTVSFRPDQEVAGITWSGKVTLADSAKGKHGKKDKKSRNGGKG